MTTGILRAVMALVATFAMSSAAWSAACLDYEPALVTLQGSIALKPAYGPPGFGEDPEHDAREDYLAFILETPVCTAASPKPDTDDVAEADIRAMQLVFPGSEAFRNAKRWIGKKISVTGGLYHGFTGHHHTTVLLTVKDIGPAR